MIQRLPVELIRLICGHLCPHCQSPTVFPNADVDETRVAKASLARLSRTCKAMCAIAQPFVFHYYATGNLPEIFVADQPGYAYDDQRVSKDDFDDDLLPLFLRSVIQRPDLAKCVQDLQLVDSPRIEDLKGGGERSIYSTIAQASVQLGLVAFDPFHPNYLDWTPDRPDPNPSEVWHHEIHHILDS
jgi:hypothetical protein